MNTIQLSLLPEAWSPLDDALIRIQSLGVRHSNYVLFVRKVAASAIGHRPGSLILCAALTDHDADEISADIAQYIHESLEKSSAPSRGVCMVGTPHTFHAREMKAALVEAYHDANDLFCAKQKTGPKFPLEGAPACLNHNPTQRIASLLKHRDPRIYLFKNIQLLQRIDSASSNALEYVRMLSQIASASGRTHILLGNSQTVLHWLACKEISELAVPVVLEPYDHDDLTDKRNFYSLLATYDKAIPWKEKDALMTNGRYVHQIVRGSPHRLRKWILNAICNARAHAQAELTWNCFKASEPTGVEKGQATLEYESICRFLGKSIAPVNKSSDEPKSAKANTKPGDRTLGRDSYAA